MDNREGDIIPFISVEKFDNGKWEEIRWDIECPCLAMCDKVQIIIKNKVRKEFKWDQKNYLCEIESGKYRFKLLTGTYQSPRTFYSNEFEISNNNKVVFNTEKEEYKLGEEVILSVKNNSNEKIKAIISLEESKEDKWELLYYSDIFCPYSGRKCDDLIISANSSKELKWPQKVPFDNNVSEGKYRFKFIRIPFDNGINEEAPALLNRGGIVYHSNGFYIRSPKLDCETKKNEICLIEENEKVRALFNSYISAGKSCNIDLANSLITEKSKEIVRYTCSNMANEIKCYEGRGYEIKVKGDNAILYLTPYSRKIENPFFFTKKNGEWKIDLYKMSNGLVMSGSTCDSGWGWRDLKLQEEFCSFFPDGQCPDKGI